MTKHDTIISELVNALYLIRHEAEERGSVAFIRGVAEQAIKNLDSQRERNSDGYLVVKS